MKTPNVEEIVQAVEARFGDRVRVGAWACRRIAGTLTWSQHSWTENPEPGVIYAGNAADIFPDTMATGDRVRSYIQAEFAETVAHLLWRVKSHFDHIHVDTWPQGHKVPPCRGAALRVKHKDGTIGRTFQPPPTPPPIMDEDMYAAVKQGDTGQAVEAWQRVMQQITGFKPPAWGVFGPETTAELEKLTGPGNNIGPAEGASLFAQLGNK